MWFLVLFGPFSFLAPKDFNIIWLSSLLTMNLMKVITYLMKVITYLMKVITNRWRLLRTWWRLLRTWWRLLRTWWMLLRTWWRLLRTWWRLLRTWWSLLRTRWRLFQKRIVGTKLQIYVCICWHYHKGFHVACLKMTHCCNYVTLPSYFLLQRCGLIVTSKSGKSLTCIYVK